MFVTGAEVGRLWLPFPLDLGALGIDQLLLEPIPDNFLVDLRKRSAQGRVRRRILGASQRDGAKQEGADRGEDRFQHCLPAKQKFSVMTILIRTPTPNLFSLGRFRQTAPVKIFLAFWLLLAAPAFAQQNSPAPTATPTFDQAAATQAWIDSIPAPDRARSDSYFEGGYWILLWDFLISAGISILLLNSRISARLRDYAERKSNSKSFQVAIYAVGYILLTALLGFPMVFYENFIREHQYGMATQNFQGWFWDWSKGLAIGVIITPLFLMLLYAVFRRAPQRWWVIGTAVVMLCLVFLVIVAPIFLEPVFNKYTPLEDAKIRDPILQLAQANQIPVKKVYVVDASRQTKRVSANVAGLFGTARIALNDNLLKQSTLPEIRAVMGHEMGHYVMNHVIKFFAFLTLLTLIAFGFTKIAFDWAVRRWGAKWGVRGIGDSAGLPLLTLIVAVIGFFGTPVTNTLTRVQEAEADAFGLNAAREPDGMAKAMLKLSAYRKMQPGALEEFVFYDHPSGQTRIRRAMDWKAANPPNGSFDPKVGKP